MRLPKDLLNPGRYVKPNIFLCETDKQKICSLETTNTQGSFKFNTYSEISFEVSRSYNDLITGQTKINPYFDYIETPRLIEVENFGYFEIQGPGLDADGIKETKSITAYSLEYTLSQKYLEDFYTANGKDEWAGSLEDLWQVKKGDEQTVPKIVLYNPNDTDASLLDLILEKVYGWKIGHVDKTLWSLSRDFNVDRQSVYDFIINEICAKFNCYVEFDTINNEINFYAESPTEIFIGDGTTNTFRFSPPFSQIETVSVAGYKTTRWSYSLEIDEATSERFGVITLEDTPASGEYVTVVGDMLQKWETDVFVTFENLAQTITVDYSADDIKTVLTVTYGDDGDIREVNLGLPYLVDLSYYYTPEWMGQDLYDAYTQYLEKTNNYQSDFTNNTQERLKLKGYQNYEEMRFGLDYEVKTDVDSSTVGSFYTRGGDAPDYYYTEVSLPSEYKAGTTYYTLAKANLNEDKVTNLFSVLQYYFNNTEDWEEELDKLERDFEFMKSPTLADLKDSLVQAKTLEQKDEAVTSFLNVIWKELGRKNLKELYLASYKTLQTTYFSMEDDEEWEGGNWSDPTHANYWFYYPITLMIETIECAIAERTQKIEEEYQPLIDALDEEIANIGDELLVVNNFTEEQMIRLSAFLREDELQLDDIVETSLDSLEVIYDTKQDAMESGRIELKKRCQPQLQFSMTMANIYALPEFEPIVGQFQLGKVIKVGLRPDYIKQSRLLQVDFGFDDFSDFSCSFGELTSLTSQSDIHADLLKQAVSAGKSVATNASYWTKGSNKATETDFKIEKGLLDAVTEIKSIDGTQGVVIDKYGIKLQKDDGSGGVDPEQVWLVNNKIVFTDDNFKTSRSALGKVTVDGHTYYGLISEIVLSGYINGSKIVGGTIQIGTAANGNPAFEVDENGNVKMLGGLVEFSDAANSIETLATDINTTISNTTQELKGQIETIESKNKYSIEIFSDGPTIVTSTNDTTALTCKVYNWDTDITDTLGGKMFEWKRTSIDPELDKIWNELPTHKGYGLTSITINHEDVYENSSFYCEIDLP